MRRSPAESPRTLFFQFVGSKEYRKMSRHDVDEIEKALRLDISQFYPGGNWILRNLTTWDYVRHGMIPLTSEQSFGGFDEAVLSWICWSTNPSYPTRYVEGLRRGNWAEQCFDITILERHREKMRAEEWTDISEEVATEIATIRDSKYGSCQQWMEGK